MTTHVRPWPRDPRYLVGTDGTIQGPSSYVLKQQVQGGRAWISYRSADKKKCTVQVSVMVCETFHGPRPEGMHAAHEDGNALNNRADNIKWKTPKENAADKYRHGTVPMGVDAVTWTKLTAEEVREIRQKRKNGAFGTTLAIEYGVNSTTIYDICNGTAWSHLS